MSLSMNMTVIRIFALLMTASLFFGVYVFALTIRHKRGMIHSAFAMIMILVSFLSLQCAISAIYPEQTDPRGLLAARIIYVLPVHVFIFITAVLIAGYVIFINDIRKFDHTHITPASVKEGLDAVPDGLLFYYDDGRVQMVNPAMKEIAFKLTDSNVINGVKLTEMLREGASELDNCTYIGTGDHPIVSFDDGSVYSFEERIRSFHGSSIHELVAIDISEEHRLHKRLEAQNEELNAYRKRLSALGESITDMTIEDEILKNRIRIHDEFGHCLTETRRYIEHGEGDLTHLIDQWRINVGLLENTDGARSDRDKIKRDYDTVLKAATDVGVNVNIAGKLPEEPQAQKIVSAAIRESITNTFRHAHGDELNIVVKMGDSDSLKEDEYIIEFTNNGEFPLEPVVERGGLKNLRTLVESSGGVMSIETEPEFKLTLEINRNIVNLLEQ